VRSPPYPVQELKRRTLSWAVRLHVNPRIVRVQQMRSKWGSCSVQGTVTLAVDLVDADERLQDFVIVHELLHLRLPMHGRLFTVLMNHYVPGWRRFDGMQARKSGVGTNLPQLFGALPEPRPQGQRPAASLPRVSGPLKRERPNMDVGARRHAAGPNRSLR
jgi:hypothetical protein